MKKYIYISALMLSFSLTSCNDMLNSKEDIYLTDKMLDTQYKQLFNFGYKAYSNINNGFSAIDGNLFSTVSDEAQYVTTSNDAQRFNEGSWNKFYNPNDFYKKGYQGIHDANFFLEYSNDYANRLAVNRDTITTENKRLYKEDILDIQRLRAEVRVLRCYYYFELMKRYGGVPLITKSATTVEEANLPRVSVEKLVSFIESEINASLLDLVTTWAAAAMPTKDGRVNRGVALAIKARTLLYAASPLNNPTNEKGKWESAAKAYNDIIILGTYDLAANYQNLFIGNITSAVGKEVIWAVRMGPNNDFERKNYPIATPGGNTGICPSQNLVAAYERKTDNVNPYQGLDPRFAMSIVSNNDTWTGRIMEMWEGGTDDPSNRNSSRTGYYLKKFLNDNLNLVNDAKMNRNWTIFRYADVLLSYAEAMNESFGPDNNNGNSLTAREALNKVRNRTGVEMPAIIAQIAPDYQSLKDKIKHERRIELAFEDYRYWDLCRWKDSETVLNQPLMGMKTNKNVDGSFTYIEFQVAGRKFIAPKMYLFPIPQSEIVKTNGVVTQNPEW